MKSIFFYIVIITCVGCRAQNIVEYKDLKYLGYSYNDTYNRSFINKRISFLSGTDSVFFNIKIAWDINNKNINDPGIFYGCQLKKDTLYSFVLKKVNISVVPEEFNSYYRTNAVFRSSNSPIFKEVWKDTPYNFVGINGMFIDRDNTLYKIEKMTPTTGCIFQH